MKSISSILKNLVTTYEEAFQITYQLLPKYFDMIHSVFNWNHAHVEQCRAIIVDQNLIEAIQSIVMGYSCYPEHLT